MRKVVSFCGPILRLAAHRVLPGALPCGVRTFLDPVQTAVFQPAWVKCIIPGYGLVVNQRQLTGMGYNSLNVLVARNPFAIQEKMTTSITQAFLLAIQILYALCSLSLLIVAINSIFSLYHYHKASKVNDQIVQPEPEYWPPVTVQLPIYNENSVIIGLLDAITGLDYPKDKLEIQVLDNSTDSTSLLAKELVEQYLDQGFNIRFHHRDSREGYKAGNLTEGLKTASGEFIAIFDADFIPQRDWIKRCVVHFSDPTLGFVQTRWTFHNRTQNELTRMASQVLDSHFLIEAIARSGNNLFLNFNGSAGMWRKEALISAGGWQTDTLVEDLDLSVRAYLAGWKGIYLKDVTASSEVPFQIEVYKKQQYRWVKGTVQVWRKYFWRILRSNLPLKTRLIFLLNYSAVTQSFPLGVLVQILFLPIGLFSLWMVPWLSWTGVALSGPIILFMLAKSDATPRIWDRLRALPGIFLIGAGVSLSCSAAVLSGLVKNGGDFYTTPRLNHGKAAPLSVSSQNPPKVSAMILGELALGIYILITLTTLLPIIGPVLWPWSLTSALGFFIVAIVSLAENLARWKQRHKKNLLRSPENGG